MRLRTDQLGENIKRKGLASVYYISGDEPLQMLEASDFIRRAARQEGCEERSVLDVGKGFDWNLLSQVSANLSLFASRRLIELRLGSQKPGKEGADALVDYISQNNSEDVLLMTSEKIDKRIQTGRWFKALDNAGVTIQIWPVERGRLPEWIKQRMLSHGKKMDHDAASLIAERVEGNLLAARQEIDKLALLVAKDNVDLKDVMEAVSDSSRFEVFDLVESCFSGNTERVARMLRGLRGEGAEPMSIFGALMWEIRRVCSMSHEIAAGTPGETVFATYRVWQQRKFATNSILKRYSVKQLHVLLQRATIVDKAMKGAIRANAWDLLENYLFRIAGVRLQSFPTQ
ncbi:MAG: DNA polymerase-3 subunit delta [Gammaproteobacteria bacterium]|jgi:DNA polymerase-3 subunit delta